MTPHVQGVKGTEARFWERGRECIEFPVPGAMPTTLKFPPFNLHMSLSQCCYLHFIDERQERKLLNVEAEPLTQICLIPKENSLSIFNFMLLLEKKNGTPQNNLYLGLLWTALTSSKWGFLKDTWHLGKCCDIQGTKWDTFVIGLNASCLLPQTSLSLCCLFFLITWRRKSWWRVSLSSNLES